MIKSFFRISLRRLAREKKYAMICLSSLSLGITCCLIISLYLLSELTYNRFHENHRRIYRVVTDFTGLELAFSGYEIGPILVRDNPQFLSHVRFAKAFENEFDYRDNSREWEEVYLTDADVFDVFTLNVIRGDIGTALNDPYSIAISQSFAEFYFSDEDPIGEILTTEKYSFRVTLLFEDLPANVQHRYDALMPFKLVEIYQPESIDDFGLRFFAPENFTYLLVPPNFDPTIMQQASDNLYQTYIAPDFPADAGRLEFSLQQLSAIHFGREIIGDQKTGNRVNLVSFAAVAMVLLVVACINYINLSTARASKRAKEVGMKKIFGASKAHLIWQFLSESMLYTSLALLIAMLATIAVLEFGIIDRLGGQAQLRQLLGYPSTLVFIGLAGLLICFLSGIYPAFYLSSQPLIRALKSARSSWRSGLAMRQLLVLLQFVASISIIVCVIAMQRQVTFLTSTPLGFKKDGQIVVRIRGADAIESIPAIIAELSRHNEISAAAAMRSAPGTGMTVTVLTVEGNDGESETAPISSFQVGPNYFDVLQIELLLGRVFSDDGGDRERGPALVNETFVTEMEWEQPLGKHIGGWEVIGVIKDFHYRPLHDPIEPMVLTPLPASIPEEFTESQREDLSREIVISTTGRNIAETAQYIEGIIFQFTSQAVIQQKPLSEIWNEHYQDDANAINLVGVFAGVSVLLSLLGLAGMASYAIEQRNKEIAIRKVLGASVTNILALLCKNLLAVISVAILPAILIGYYATNVWLQRFAYQADFSVVPYLAAIVIVSTVSIATLLIQSYQSAQANPINKLRYE